VERSASKDGENGRAEIGWVLRAFHQTANGCVCQSTAGGEKERGDTARRSSPNERCRNDWRFGWDDRKDTWLDS
jgi:hypothetical protein